jgi:hypothetical protein
LSLCVLQPKAQADSISLLPLHDELAPSAPKLAPSAPELAPSAPELAPSAPQLASSALELALSAPELPILMDLDLKFDQHPLSDPASHMELAMLHSDSARHLELPQPLSALAKLVKVPMCCGEVFDVNFNRLFAEIETSQTYPGIQPGNPAEDLTWCMMGFSAAKGFCLELSLF